MSDFSAWQEKQKITMAEQIGKIEEFIFMQKTACVHLEEREIIAWCMSYKIIAPEDTDFNEFLEKVAIPVLTYVGRGKWYRDTLTDLGFALSAKQRKSTSEDAGDVLEAKIE